MRLTSNEIAHEYCLNPQEVVDNICKFVTIRFEGVTIKP